MTGIPVRIALSTSKSTGPTCAPTASSEPRVRETGHPVPAVTLTELLERQAARTPDALAVTYQGRGLSYRELHERANQLARHLVALGAGPERVIAIAMHRSELMVVALLAIL